MNIEFIDFLNVFDIFSLIIIIFSALFSLKGGLMISLLNLIKWILLVLALKFSFNYLRVPFTDALDLSPTVIDILIFTSVLIVGYVILTILNRLTLGLLNAEPAIVEGSSKSLIKARSPRNILLGMILKIGARILVQAGKRLG